MEQHNEQRGAATEKDGVNLSEVDFGKLGKFGALVAAAAAITSGCGPAKVDLYEDVGPNQTAFKIDYDGDKQTQFESEKFLSERKVPAKRVMIDQTTITTGRGWWNYKWIPTIVVIKVDRGLVTREWTSDTESGTKAKNEALLVTTKDGTGIHFGINLTARIDEPLAARYLYFHGKRPLNEVVDTNIRSDIQGILSGIVGGMSRTEVQNNLPKIFTQLIPEVKKLATDRGITIETIGPAEGIKYANPAIQKAIDDQVIAEAAKKTAQQRQEAAKIDNETMVQNATARGKAAKEVAANMEAMKKQQELEIGLKNAEARLELARKWDGKLPENIMPSDAPILNQLGVGGGGK